MFCSRIIAVVLAMVSPLSAQVAGRLSGTVTDPSGAAIPGAKVSVMLAGGQTAVLATTTSGEGIFDFIGVRPEFYDVHVEFGGFRSQALRRVKVDPGLETAMGSIRLEVGSVTETIEVQAESLLIQTANAEIATTVTNDQMRRLPSYQINWPIVRDIMREREDEFVYLRRVAQKCLAQITNDDLRRDLNRLIAHCDRKIDQCHTLGS